METNFRLKMQILKIFGNQADFAQAVGVSEALVSRIIRGRRELNDSDKRMWAKKLKMKREELFKQ
jgi:DNA-binding transcriptional regulator YdaS (Cro superfamily)